MFCLDGKYVYAPKTYDIFYQTAWEISVFYNLTNAIKGFDSFQYNFIIYKHSVKEMTELMILSKE